MTKGNRIEVLVCLGTGCESAKSNTLFESFEEQVRKKKLGDRVEIKRIGCHGLCEQGPVIAIEPEGLFYCKVKHEDVEQIVDSHFVKNEPIEELFFESRTGERISHYKDIKVNRYVDI